MPGGGNLRLSRSQALRRASIKSELRRAYAVSALLLVLAASITIRAMVDEVPSMIRLVATLGVGALLVLQVVTLWLVHRVARRDRASPGGGAALPMGFAACSVVLEALVPTGMMYAHLKMSTLPPYAVISLPPVLLCYALFALLTTLRLRPWLCVLQSGVAAAGYIAVLLHARALHGPGDPSTGVSAAAYANAPVLIFLGGVAAAWVARELRGHLIATLDEAELRRKLDAVMVDMQVVQSIQQALLPRATPAIPGFEVAGWNRPADQTGGDYYDWLKLPDGNWLITLADVSGHGIGPAMVTAACRAYIRASVSHDPDLSTLATRVNMLLASDLPDGRFVTLASAIIKPASAGDQPSTPNVALLSAGQGPIVLYIHATSRVEDLPPRDVPLAVLPDAAFGPAEALRLEPGDVLAFVTDGFTEWARPATSPNSPREQFGLDRLRESLARHARKPPAQVIEGVVADVTAFAGASPQSDDMTMVVIRRV